MAKFYYTYGTNEHHPFNGGWTEINADSRDIADKIFGIFHPNSPGKENYLNCAFIYDEKTFRNTEMGKRNCNLGAGCQECIDVTKTVYNSDTIVDGKFNVIGAHCINIPKSAATIIQKAYFPDNTDSDSTLSNITAAMIAVEPCNKEKYGENVKHLEIAFSGDGSIVTVSIIYEDNTVKNKYPYRNEALSLAKNIYEQMRTMDTSDKNEILSILQKYIF